MEKEKLIELSKQYFDNKKDLKEILASSDGHFFYTEADASYHVAKKDVIMYKIKREDLKPKKTVNVKKEVPKKNK